MKDFILPIIALLGGLFSLYIDSKDTTKRWLFILGLSFTALVTIVFNANDSRTKEEEKNLAVTQETKKVKREMETSDKLFKILAELSANVNDTKSRVAFLTNFGYSASNAEKATPQDLASAVRADRAYNSFVRSESRFPNLTVEYYPKDFDSEKVKKSIETLGIRTRVVPPNNDIPTNAIWVGPNVPDDAIRFVGVTLVRAGAKIARISRVPNPTGARVFLLQIGADPALVDKPPLSLEAIESVTNAQLN